MTDLVQDLLLDACDRGVVVTTMKMALIETEPVSPVSLVRGTISGMGTYIV